MFVCTGNTCRSAMAEHILKRILKENSFSGVTVSSSGLNVTETSMNDFARKSLGKMGIRPRKFVPKQTTVELAEKQSAVICMTNMQKSAFVDFDNVYSFDELTGLGDVPDPYGKTQADYDLTAQLLIKGCEKIYNLIIEAKK